MSLNVDRIDARAMLTRGRNRKEAEVGQVGGIPGPKTKKACKNRLLTFAIWWVASNEKYL
jgi:hypothetical protein